MAGARTLSRERLQNKKNNLGDEARTSTLSPDSAISPDRLPPTLSRGSSNLGVSESIPSVGIEQEFSRLRDAITTYVRKFYSIERANLDVSQTTIERASIGMMLPWPQIRTLVLEPKSRLATLALCISWTTFSRSLLLKLGISKTPGSTFLPPEMVECFQSFSHGKGAVTIEAENGKMINFALLSQWKCISATLLHSTYVTDAFSYLDSRTVNIDRALADLGPLLSTFALTRDGTDADARVADLRDVLCDGARFAFTLFGQSSFWKFDWSSDRVARHGKTESQLKASRIAGSTGGVAPSSGSVSLMPAELVVRPRLLGVLDGEGSILVIDKEGSAFGSKRYLNDFGMM